MEPVEKKVKLGLIVCRDCGHWIEEVDTEKVTLFYSKCDTAQCQTNSKQGEQQHAAI